MRYIRLAFWGCLGILLVSVSLANRDSVSLRLIPEGVTDLFGFNMGVQLPLFVVILGGVAAGLVIGFVWEWLREHKHRRDANVKAREVRSLKREVGRLKEEKHQGKDEVLAILDETG